MTSPDRTLRRLVREWLSKAEEDLLVAQELMERDRLSYNPVGFHAQQAAEKFLKALLTRQGVAFPRTHDVSIILLLAEQCSPGIGEALRDAYHLTPYGVDVRYPGDDVPLTREEGAEAVRLAAAVRSEVLSRLDDFLKGETP
jgi:HEPN domain-containing protein